MRNVISRRAYIIGPRIKLAGLITALSLFLMILPGPGGATTGAPEGPRVPSTTVTSPQASQNLAIDPYGSLLDAYVSDFSPTPWPVLFYRNDDSAPTLGPPWPMQGHDAKRTGRTTVSGPVTATVKWTYQFTSGVFHNTLQDQASPVVGPDGTIYQPTNDAFYAINPNGTLKWSLSLPGLTMRNAPALSIDGNTVYIVDSSYDEGIAALDAQNGNVLWQYTFVGGGYVNYSSFAVDGNGTIYVGTIVPAALHAVNPDGTLKWRYAVPGGESLGIEAAPAIDANGNVYVEINGTGLVALDANGNYRWTSAPGGDYGWFTPTVGPDGTIYVAGDIDGQAPNQSAYALNPDGSVKWQRSAAEIGAGGFFAGMTISADGSTVYTGRVNGKVYALDAATGATQWESQISTTDAFSGSPVLSNNGILYLAGWNGYIYAVWAGDGSLLWQYELETVSMYWGAQSPALGPDGTLYAVSSGLPPAYGGIKGRLYAFKDSGCWFMLNSMSQSFPAAGGTDSVNVAAGEAGCDWTAVSNDAFITITSGSSGSGNGTVDYSVEASPLDGPRSGTMTIAGRTFKVNQAGIVPPTFAISDVTHNEGNVGTTSYTLTVTKTGSTPLNCSVDFTTVDGTATTADNDYQAQSGTLTFLPTYTTRQITVLVNGDTTFEPNEAFTVHLSGASGATISDADGSGTITNDDAPPLPALGNYPDTTVQAGGNTTVTPDAAPTNTTSMNVSTTSDFRGTFAASQTTGVVYVTNAQPAGTYTVTVTAFNSWGVTTTKMFTLTVNNPIPCDTPGFSAASGSPFAVGSWPLSVAVGDFNGDGKQDLAIANYSSNSVTVLLGNDGGGFSAGSGSPFAVGSSPHSVAVGDFNRDGKQDLATANSSSKNVTVLLGNGSGGFTPASGSPFAIGSFGLWPEFVAVGDFNGDGKLDLTTANYDSNNVTVLLGNGSGGFSAAPGSPFAVGSHPASVAVGDFNGDGKLDLATTSSSNNMTVLLGDGSGGFSAASGSPFAVGTGPVSVAVGDFNSDGNQDLATANAASSNVTLLLGNGSGGFSAASGSPFVVGTNPNSIAVGDFNGDGKQDLTTANYSSNNVTVLLGNGGGSFSPTTGSPFAVGSVPQSLAIGDFNGDGKQDLATANRDSNNVTVLLGNCVVAPTLGTYPDTSMQAGANTTVTPDEAPTNTTSMNVSTASTFKGAFAASPATGVVQVTNAQPAKIYTVTVKALNSLGVTATKTFTLTVNNATACINATFSGASGSPFAVGSHPYSVVVGDFNRDGKQDMATSNDGANNVTVLLGNGSGGFSAAGGSPFAVGAAPHSVAVGDFNGDGKQDLATANYSSNNVTVLLGDGSGSFTAAGGSPFAVGSSPQSVAVGDFNGDGKLDLAVANSNSNNVTVLLGNISGGFTAASGSPFAVGGTPYSVVIGDFNSDGKLDLTTANDTSNNVTVLLGNGSGGFSPATGSPFAVGSYPQAVAASDFNGDGKLDLTTANVGSDNVTVLLGDGSGGFSPASGSPFAVGLFSGPRYVAVGDFNGDGKLDLTTANSYANKVTVLLGNGSGGFTVASGSPFAVGSSPYSVAVGDFNGDGKLDLTVANYTANNLTVLLNTCTAATAPTIGAAAVTRQQGSPFANATIANVNDLEDLETALTIRVNGGTSATVNGVTVSSISVSAAGVVTADVIGDCSATTATFTLRVTDTGGLFNEATLTVTVNPNTAPTLTYASPQALIFGGSLNVTPTATSDNGAVTYAVQAGHGLMTAPTVDSSGVVSITNAQPAGAHTVTIRATDNCGAFTDATFTLDVGEMPTFSIDNVTHNEGSSGTTAFIFTVNKNGSTALNLAVDFTTVDGTATTADNDYQANSGTLDFAPADTTKQITVLVNGDTTFEPDEAFTVQLSGATIAVGSQAPSEALGGIGTITNDDSLSISGHVVYANGTTPGKNVTMTLTAPSFTTQTTTTDANGDYSFANLPGGNDYTLTPTKTGDNGNGLQSFDAAFAARYVAGLDIPTTMQRMAADADGDGNLSSFDAALIARRAAGLPGSGIVGTWKFSPVNRTYPALGVNQTGQNFTAILVGDTSGDWTPTLPAGGGDENARAGVSLQSPNGTVGVTVSLPHVTGPNPSLITVPITVGNLTGEQVKAYDLQVTFDPLIVTPDATPTDIAGTRSSGMFITPNTGNSGHLIISAFRTNDLSGSGTLIKLRFNIIGAPGQVSPLTFENYTDGGAIFHPGCRFNAGTPACVPTNGSIHVNGPTASSASISGQIVTADGQPLSGTTVTVMGGAGTIRAITNGNGFYQVENLETGGFYTVTPSRANFAFAPSSRSFSLVGNSTDAVFTGMPISPDGNPLESPEFFVRQQYLDFLGREPDRGGLEYWSAQLRSCGNDVFCIETRRLDISAAFFIAQEFQDSGLYIYDMYEGALGRRPDHAEYAVDRTSVVGGPNLEADKAAFAESFVERPEFGAQYPLTMSDEVFVDALLRTVEQSSGLNLGDTRASLIDLYNTGAGATESRSLVLRSVVESSRFKQTQYNPAFVLMEYYGYLGRNPDREGYDFWLNVLNSGDRNNYRGMVCSFITSAEYQYRFSSVVTRSNAECGRIAPPAERKQ